MGSLWQAPAAVVVLVTWLTATPVSLADVARREALRRQATPASASVFTNDDLPFMAPAAVSGVERVATAPPAEEGAEEAEPAPAPEPVKDEQWWRDRMATARTELAKNQELYETGQARVDALQAEFVSYSDPAKREAVRDEFATVRAGVQKTKEVVQENQRVIAEIEAEAIEAGIPLEWIRPSGGF